jgi:hypothetical protein
MYSSRTDNLLLMVYKEKQTVFRLRDIALLSGESDFISINKKLNYYVRTGRLGNPRKGIYTKQGYNPEEMACIVNTPSYISMEYVLQKAGIIFQYDTRITVASYLSRSINIEGRKFVFRKLRGEILIDTTGIIRQDNHINIATAERAFLDLMYLNSDNYFDNLNPLSKKNIYELLPVYNSGKLNKRVKEILQNGRYKPS